MPISSYQVEWLIHQRRRWRGLLRMVERALFAAPDSVELSPQGREQAVELPAPQPRRAAGAEIWPANLADRHPYPAPVAHELERRAGSFMRPKVLPHPPRPGIPRVRPKEAAERKAQDE